VNIDVMVIMVIYNGLVLDVLIFIIIVIFFPIITIMVIVLGFDTACSTHLCVTAGQ
jgi:hypothetical protein